MPIEVRPQVDLAEAHIVAVESLAGRELATYVEELNEGDGKDKMGL